jgi:NADH-quinone oxidoreductase subunit L
MPVTFWTFLAGTLALCGVWPLSGFFSKDSILAAAYNGSMTLFAVATLVAFLTSFYMFRLFFVVFLGQAKSDLPAHAHESPRVMTWPLIVLALASVAGGFFGILQFIAPQYDELVPGVFAPLEPFRTAPMAACDGLLAFAVGLALAFHFYRNATSDPLPVKLQTLTGLLRHKFYFDEFYASLIETTQEALATSANGVDIVLQWLIRVVQATTELTGRVLRLVQTGSLQTYTFLFAAGIALTLYLMLLR